MSDPIITLSDHIKENQKDFGKVNELLKISGEHMSYFRKDITDIKKTLEHQDEKSEIHRTTMHEFMKRVEPVLLAYEKAKIVKESDNERGENIVTWSVRITALGVIGGAALWVWTKLKGL